MVNARLMGGADWREMGWVEYLTMLEAWNAAHGGSGSEQPAASPGGSERMRRALLAHRVN